MITAAESQCADHVDTMISTRSRLISSTRDQMDCLLIVIKSTNLICLINSYRYYQYPYTCLLYTLTIGLLKHGSRLIVVNVQLVV